MVKATKLAKEIVVTVVNKIGVLADMSNLLAKSSINIEAVAGYAINNEAKIMLVTEDATNTVDILKKNGYNSINENEVVIVELENQPGALKLITGKLAAGGIDIKQVYGSTCAAASCPARIILSTSDNQKALTALS